MFSIGKKGFFGQSLEAKIFAAIIVLALFARIFVLFALPDTALTDSMYHLSITKYIVENHALPFYGIPEAGVVGMPVPLFHILTAGFFVLFQLPVTLAFAKVFPAIFSFLQLLLSFLILRKLFPKNWVFGFAFVAISPLLVIFGAVNYLETLASVTVLLCFFVYWCYVETGRKIFLVAMPLALMLLAISKENATVLVPVFFVFFLYEIIRKMPSKGLGRIAWTAGFAIASVLLCSAWFAVNFAATGSLGSAFAAGAGSMAAVLQVPVGFESIFFYPLNFNSGFWFFLPQGFESAPFGISQELAFAAFTLVSFPVLMLVFFGLAKGLLAGKEPRFKAFLLLGLCLAVSLGVLFLRGQRFVHGRMLLPVLPLLGIAFSCAFAEIKSANWKRFLAAVFMLFALYSAAFSSLYAMHFNEDYNSHAPLYQFVKELPEGSIVAIHANKVRQIESISGKETVPYPKFAGLEPNQLYSKLVELNVTHLAETCYKNPWDKVILDELESQGLIAIVFSDSCSTLYDVKR
ncbi:MAG: hypothetical protein WC634_01160 [archaeon]